MEPPPSRSLTYENASTSCLLFHFDFHTSLQKLAGSIGLEPTSYPLTAGRLTVRRTPKIRRYKNLAGRLGLEPRVFRFRTGRFTYLTYLPIAERTSNPQPFGLPPRSRHLQK
jgi:hypothetical protein